MYKTKLTLSAFQSHINLRIFRLHRRLLFIMSDVVRYVLVRPSVCLSSVTFVRPTQAIEIFGNVSTPFGTLAIFDLLVKILRRSSQENPYVGGVKQNGVAEYSDFGLSNAISRKQCKIGAKLILITNRKSHMSFRLVPNSVTLDALERRNSLN